jgi:integrase
MATIQQRGNVYRVQVRRAGKKLSATFDTRREALDWATRAEADILSGRPVQTGRPSIDPAEFTGAAMLIRYSDEVSPLKRGARWEQLRLKKLAREYEVFRLPAVQISGPSLARWRDARLKEVSPSTVNRELCLISSVFSKAMREWEVGISSNPVAAIEKPRKPRARTQRVSEKDRITLERQLGWNGTSRPVTLEQYTAAAFKFATLTAMRRGEILSLDWGEVYFDKQYAHLDLTKNGEERDVPLSKKAIELLHLLEPGEPNARVFPIQPGTMDVIFRNARKATNLTHLHFHDSRREATTNMAPKFNILELSAITGHKDLQMLKVYYNPDPTDLAKRL